MAAAGTAAVDSTNKRGGVRVATAITREAGATATTETIAGGTDGGLIGPVAGAGAVLHLAVAWVLGRRGGRAVMAVAMVAALEEGEGAAVGSRQAP